MKTKILFPSLFCIALGVAHAGLLDIDFQPSSNNDGTETGFTAFEVAHFGTYTNLAGTSVSNGGVTFTFDSGTVAGFNQGSTDALIGDVFFFNTGSASSTLTFTISGLVANTDYDLTIWAGADNNRDTVMTIGSDSITANNNSVRADASATGTFTSSASGTLVGTFSGGPSGQAEANLSGLSVAIPEPSSLALLGIFVLALVVTRKKLS